MTRVGFIGLGQMGGAMAERIIGAGFPTVLWAQRPEALAAFDAPNVESAASPAELAALSELVGICVWGDDDVRQVLLGERGVLAGCRPRTLVAIHSTILPATSAELAATAAESDVVVIDAPVSGGRDGALSGSLTVAVGGDVDAIERCRPVFATFASSVLHLGGIGAAQFAKLINNTLLAANLALADDALSLGQALGVEAGAFGEFLRGGSGRSFGLDAALMARASAEARHGALVPLEKDVRCLTEEVAPKASAAGALLREAAREALVRLDDPPAGWS